MQLNNFTRTTLVAGMDALSTIPSRSFSTSTTSFSMTANIIQSRLLYILAVVRWYCSALTAWRIRIHMNESSILIELNHSDIITLQRYHSRMHWLTQHLLD